jgi:small-conductance mechanosensitive channel
MAQLAPVVTLAATGASIYAQSQEAARQKKNAQVQQQNAQVQQDAQQQVLAAQATQNAGERRRSLERSIASARARLAAGGVNPDQGSGAALAAGLRGAAQEAQAADDATYAARLSAGRKSLLDQDSSLTNWVRAGQGLGRAVKSLLD